MSNYEDGNHIEFTEEVFLQAGKQIQSNPRAKDKYLDHLDIQKLLEEETHDFPISDIWSTFHLAYEMMEDEYNVPIEYRLCEMEYGHKERMMADDHANYYREREKEETEDAAETAAKDRIDLETEHRSVEWFGKAVFNVAKYGVGKKRHRDYVIKAAGKAHVKYFQEAYVNEYVYGKSSTAKKAICEMLDYFSYEDFAEELVRQLHRRMYMCKIARDLRGCHLTSLKEISWRNKIDETWLKPFCNDVVIILDLEASKVGIKESVLDSWKMIENTATAKWGKNSNIAKCLKKKCHFCYSYNPQTLEYADIVRARERIEVAKNEDLKREENERLKAEWRVIKEEQRKKDLLKKEAIKLQKQKEKEELRAEKQAQKEKERAERSKLEEGKWVQKGTAESVKQRLARLNTKLKKIAEFVKQELPRLSTKRKETLKKGAILVPLLNREVPRWKLISVTAGILSLIALATSIPILMLNKSSRTKAPNNVQKIEDIGTKKEITKEPESPTVGKKGIVPSSTPQPGKTSPDEFVKGENAGEKIDSGIKPSPTPLPGETERQPSQETLQPPALETQAGKRGIGPHGPYGVPGVEKPAGESPKTEVPPKTPSTDTKRWITPESTERRLINGRWYKKRYIESPSGSGRHKEVWVPE